IPGTPVSAVGDFEYAVEGTLVESLGEPQVIYRKNSDNSWSLADASGVVTSDDRVSSADLANGELEFRVHTPSTAAGMEFPAHTLSDRGELEFLPVLSAISTGNVEEGAGYYTKHPDGNWRFVPPVGSTQESGFILTPEEFGRVIAQQQMTAYPTSALPTVPQIGARAISSRELDALPQGSILTDGVRTDGEARVFVKDADGTWALHNRSGVEQATGFTSTDIEGISRIAGV